MATTVLVAGATGDLGSRIVRELLTHDTTVRVLTRPGSGTAQRQYGETPRVDIVEAAYTDPAALEAAASGVDVVVSAINGLRSVIIDAQRALLEAAVSAGVKRFIPSDYSDDYRRIARGSNRKDAPRVVEIAGNLVTARDLAATMTGLTGTPFKLQWAGTTGTLSVMGKIGRRFSKNPDEVFPAWQGMQYLVSMFSGQATLHHLNNDRYGPHTWATTRDVLAEHLERTKRAA